MKSIISILLLTCFTALLIQAQDKKPLSPPMSATGTIGAAAITIDYNAPSKRGRTLWGDLVPYGRVWRTGANDATKITIDKDIMVNGESLPAGTYALFTIPDEKVWTVIFNSDANQWGAYNYDEAKDVLRVEVEPSKSEEMKEAMAFDIADDQLHFGWGDLTIALSLSEGN